MSEDIPFSDKQFFRVLPLLVSYIKTDKKLTDEEILKFMRMFPEHRGHDHGNHRERMLNMASKYKDDKIFGKAIEVVLSEEGKRWMDGFFEQVSKIVPENIKNFE